jgi:hypothetical protein
VEPGRSDGVGTVGPPVYQELHRLAGMHTRGERPGHPLQTTALVNEAYLRLQKADGVRWQNRPHFCAVVARRCATFSLILRACSTSRSEMADGTSTWTKR